MKLRNILIVVKDIARARKYYHNLFGLDMLLDNDGNMILTEGLVLQQEACWTESLNKEVLPRNNHSELYFEETDIEAFAVAGAFVIFLMSLEMILDIEIFKNQGPIKEATLVPLVFPLLAGAGAFTTLLSLRAEYASVNIIIALVLNMIWVYFVVSMTGRVERFLGKGGIYIIRKFFGIILLAISVRLFTANITLLIEALHRS